jgi:hypothetical protein
MEDLTQDQEDLLDLYMYINVLCWNVMNAQQKIDEKKYKYTKKYMAEISDIFMDIIQSLENDKMTKELHKLDPDIFRSRYESFKNEEFTLDPNIALEHFR